MGTHPQDDDSARARAEAVAWLQSRLGWEDRLARLRRPGGGRPPRRRPRPPIGLRRAG
ncbi:MAG TPA: hypothetical protein VF152_05355 [Acidimicrobiia bacterium]